MNRYIPAVDVAVDCVDDAGTMDELLLSSRRKNKTKQENQYYSFQLHHTIMKVPTTQYFPQGICVWRLQLGIQQRVAHPEADGFYASAKCFQISVQQEHS